VGCELGQIAKSLVFARESTGRPVLVITSGANRVDEGALAARLGENSIRKPDGDFVREQTGFAIGGVAPLAHSQPIETYIDEDLLRYPEIWAAAGTPHALFRLDPADLPRMTGGSVIPVQ
jgi:prolyl-tRNA editing enzyme YbaK/EbsC (Cys-tRNA(Pro) deacylase)